MGRLPELVENCVIYSNLVSTSEETGVLDLSELKWIYPTTSLPLVCEYGHNHSIEMRFPRDSRVSDYISNLIVRGRILCVVELIFLLLDSQMKKTIRPYHGSNMLPGR